ncbi:MAG TPA: glycosyl hydrolase family 28-related protein, partial [Methanosarcina sp.]|nr:glycosyl hydrolase family 28-related protein [Methanosarcina sp.]
MSNDTTFVSGTTVTSAWLQDVNNLVFRGQRADGTLGSAVDLYNQGGTGAKNRTVQNKFQDSVSVTDFTGVDPTGVSDSTAGIQAALNTGKKVLFPAGTYKISSVLNITVAGTSIEGDGYGLTYITQTTLNTGIVSSTVINFRLKGVYLSYSGTPISGATAIYSSGANSHFADFIIGNSYTGMEITSGTAQYIDNFQIQNYVNIGLYIHATNDVYVNTFIINAGNATNGALG